MSNVGAVYFEVSHLAIIALRNEQYATKGLDLRFGSGALEGQPVRPVFRHIRLVLPGSLVVVLAEKAPSTDGASWTGVSVSLSEGFLLRAAFRP